VDSLTEKERPMSFVKALVKLQEDCDVHNLKMSDYGIGKEEIPALAEHARETMAALFNMDPYYLSLEETIEIMNKAYR